MKLLQKIAIIITAFAICFTQSDPYNVLAAENGIDASEPDTEETTTAHTSDDTVELEVILNIDQNLMKKYIEGFEQKYPNIRIKYTQYSDYEQKIQERIAQNNYGDVLFIPASMDSNGVMNYLEPLGEVDILSQKYNFVDNAYVLKNQVYSLPSCAYMKGIVYNEELFHEAGITQMPKSMDEFIGDLELIKERTDAIPFYTCYNLDWTINDWSFFPYIEMTGDADFKGFKFVYAKNPFLEGGNYYSAYKLLYDIVNSGLCEEESNLSDWGEICQKINDGEIASVVVGSWALSQVKAFGESDSIGFMPFPNEINGKQYVTIGLDYGYSISKNSKHKDEARKFIDYMLDESGYALENDKISIVKTDPLPDVYKKLDDVVMLISKPFTDNTYQYYSKLRVGIDPDSADSIKSVIDVAAGRKNGDYDSLMQDWNMRWEKARPLGMHTMDYQIQVTQESIDRRISDEEGLNEMIMNNYTVKFSRTEQDYIRGKHGISVGYLVNRAPFQYQERNELGVTQFCGLSSVICKTIQDNTQLYFEYKAYMDTQSMIEDLQAGKIDLIAGIESTNGYAADIKLSKDYLELSNIILKSDAVDIENLEGSIQGYLHGEKNTIHVAGETQSISFDTYPELLGSVNSNQVDFSVLNYYSANYYLKAGNYSDVTLIPLTQKSRYCLGFSKDVDTRLISICNKCIYSIPEESMEMSLMQYMDFDQRKVTLKRYIEENPISASIFCMLLLIFILGVVFLIRYEKERSKRKHEIDTKRYEILSQLTDEYVFEYEYKSDNIHFDQKFNERFGFGENIRLSDCNHVDAALEQFLMQFIKSKEQDATNTSPFELTDKNQDTQWYCMRAYRIMGNKNQPEHVIGKLVNVQQTVEERKKIQDRANRDALTTLYNRIGFDKQVAERMQSCPHNVSMVYAVLDLDNFKAVNDTLGHLGGDEALKYLGNRLLEISSDNIITARFGGDEFVICMFGVLKEEADEVLKNLVSAMNTELTFEGNKHHISISLGGVYAEKITPVEQLFSEADKALYDVKSAGKNNYQLKTLNRR